ncbi:MAG: hypothetical protein EXS52_02235 [Candidatus Staskawiczbacteria bacterium]|nr:hypothetical protein [Candidatus Staskawiczbacteria bacterium]
MKKVFLIGGILLALFALLIVVAIITTNQWCWGCNVYGSREEITKLAIVKNNPLICERVGWTDTSGGWPARNVNLCYVDVAIATKNIEVCKMTPRGSGYSVDNSYYSHFENCYVLASKSPETDFLQCGNIKVSNVKRDCYADFAKKLNSPLICENIDNEIEKHKCILYEVLTQESFSKNLEFYKQYCAPLTNEYDKYQCNKFLNTNQEITIKDWKTYKWSYYSYLYTFKYPSNWNVSELPTNYKSNILGGLFFNPPSLNDDDRILVNRVQCGTSSSQTKCVMFNNQIPIWTSTKNPQILKTFDLFVENIK